MINPVIVVGSPYSGTSIVARLLQTRLGVMMDEGPLRTDEDKPFGYYEDHRLQQINKIAFEFCLPRVGKNNKEVPIQWAAEFAKWLYYRSQKYELWGFKDPGMVGLIRNMKQFLDKPTWIVCKRDDDEVIKSQVERGYPESIAKEGVKAYNVLLERELLEHKIVDMSKRRAEDSLVEELKDGIWPM